LWLTRLPGNLALKVSDISQILNRINDGEPHAAAELLPLVYEELRKLAAAKLAHEKPGQTLDATALVHEAYVRMVRARSPSEANEPSLAGAAGSPEFANRRHFFAAAAETMRRVLVDRARRKKSQKRGGDRERHDWDAFEIALPEPREDLIALDAALEKLAQSDPQAAELVQLRFFAGFTLLDAAEILGVSPRTAHRLWAYARAFLHQEIAG
jgi:RNA polymerase sigma factor (TIGR02999 family)